MAERIPMIVTQIISSNSVNPSSVLNLIFMKENLLLICGQYSDKFEKICFAEYTDTWCDVLSKSWTKMLIL